MTGKKSTDITQPATGQFLVYEAEDGRLKIDVMLENETVWLTQRLLAELFQKDVRTINEHIQNVYEERELVPEATIRKFRIVQKEGSRDVARMVDFYNLDMIISVGYRVKSHVATRFRIWATQRLKEYIVKGFVLDDERLKNPDQPFLNINDRDILCHAGKISHEMARLAAEDEYEKFHRKQLADHDRIGNDFDKMVKQLPGGKRGEKD